MKIYSILLVLVVLTAKSVYGANQLTFEGFAKKNPEHAQAFFTFQDILEGNNPQPWSVNQGRLVNINRVKNLFKPNNPTHQAALKQFLSVIQPNSQPVLPEEDSNEVQPVPGLPLPYAKLPSALTSSFPLPSLTSLSPTSYLPSSPSLSLSPSSYLPAMPSLSPSAYLPSIESIPMLSTIRSAVDTIFIMPTIKAIAARLLPIVWEIVKTIFIFKFPQYAPVLAALNALQAAFRGGVKYTA
ncbi:hypothetical protein M8J75_001475 [Diaphorina citri]|nr:hypothetical protein M8J75_001475 [Diaphorina citri]KAI5746556.1 hypothetical protein M8J77_004829 [Diaphorina citri]